MWQHQIATINSSRCAVVHFDSENSGNMKLEVRRLAALERLGLPATGDPWDGRFPKDSAVDGWRPDPKAPHFLERMRHDKDANPHRSDLRRAPWHFPDADGPRRLRHRSYGPRRVPWR